MTDNRRALVVDDHPTNRLLAGAMLKKLGWTVSEASSGDEALDIAAANPFELILLDISMPGLSGEETCKQLRSNATVGKLRILAYTAHAFPEDQEKLMACGFDAVLVKPISRQRLEELVADL